MLCGGKRKGWLGGVITVSRVITNCPVEGTGPISFSFMTSNALLTPVYKEGPPPHTLTWHHAMTTITSYKVLMSSAALDGGWLRLFHSSKGERVWSTRRQSKYCISANLMNNGNVLCYAEYLLCENTFSSKNLLKSKYLSTRDFLQNEESSLDATGYIIGPEGLYNSLDKIKCIFMSFNRTIF